MFSQEKLFRNLLLRPKEEYDYNIIPVRPKPGQRVNSEASVLVSHYITAMAHPGGRGQGLASSKAPESHLQWLDSYRLVPYHLAAAMLHIPYPQGTYWAVERSCNPGQPAIRHTAITKQDTCNTIQCTICITITDSHTANNKQNCTYTQLLYW